MIDDMVKALSQWQLFLDGFITTIWLCAVSIVVSLLFATLLLVPLMSRTRAIRTGTQLLIDGIRCIPFLLLAYLAYYCLPVLGIRIDNWRAALLTLIVYNTAYFAEILRGAWSHLPTPQEEGGRAFGFTGIRLLIHIVGPQLFIAAAPLLGNQTIQLIKDSAFLMVITVPELTFKANEVQAIYFIPFFTFIIAAGLYWIMCSAVEWAVRRFELRAQLVRMK